MGTACWPSSSSASTEAVRLYGRAIQVSPKDRGPLPARPAAPADARPTDQGREMLTQARTLDPRGRFGSLAKGLLQPSP
ncbi:MAG: hypothetical protein R3F43_21840 [bacterium]